MLKVVVKSTEIFAQSLRFFAQSSDLLAQSANKWAQSTKGVQGDQGGVSTINVGILGMWNNWKMKSTTFIHNDDLKCFHVVVQGSHKLVLMGHINFEDRVLN